MNDDFKRFSNLVFFMKIDDKIFDLTKEHNGDKYRQIIKTLFKNIIN